MNAVVTAAIWRASSTLCLTGSLRTATASIVAPYSHAQDRGSCVQVYFCHASPSAVFSHRGGLPRRDACRSSLMDQYSYRRREWIMQPHCMLRGIIKIDLEHHQTKDYCACSQYDEVAVRGLPHQN